MPNPRSAAVARVRGLYAITGERPDLGRTHFDVALAAIDAGAAVVQFRDKVRAGEAFVEAALPVRDLCCERGVAFVVNDDAASAMELRADGLHLGQGDLAGLAAWSPSWDAFLGISAQTPDEALEAVGLGADYVGAGPVFATSTKLDAGRPIGLDGLEAIRAAVDVPIAAIGGIGHADVGGVFRAGADAVCVISAIAYAHDMRAAASRFAEEVARWA